jgi:hypothetical protein
MLARGVDLCVLASSPANHILRFERAPSETGYARSDGSVNSALHHKRKRSGQSAARILGMRLCHCDSSPKRNGELRSANLCQGRSRPCWHGNFFQLRRQGLPVLRCRQAT